MMKSVDKLIPDYKGQRWVSAKLPRQLQPWIDGKRKSIRQRKPGHSSACERLHKLMREHEWRWPKKPVYFITDIHADADALTASLVASGTVKKTGSEARDFRLTRAARKSRFIIGGDCFDKGPSSLELLRTLKRLYKRGANLHLLAGNHDIRVMLGMRCVGKKRSAHNEHFFVRMGPKAVPLIKEICEEYVNKSDLKKMPSNDKCRSLLYPSAAWQRQFPQFAKELLPKAVIERELEKIDKKIDRFEKQCADNDLSMKQVLAATLKWQQLFLKPGGEFHWFYDRMRLFYRQGSFLFMHAGLDDEVAALIHTKGIKHINRRFRKLINQDDLSFYYGPIANSIRTKYRAADHKLTNKGARLANESGIHAIVHGHRNLYHGQRIALRRNLVNFECDTTMDSGSRRKEGLKGAGAGVTIIRPEQVILGISSDHDYIKVFDPAAMLC